MPALIIQTGVDENTTEEELLNLKSYFLWTNDDLIIGYNIGVLEVGINYDFNYNVSHYDVEVK